MVKWPNWEDILFDKLVWFGILLVILILVMVFVTYPLLTRCSDCENVMTQPGNFSGTIIEYGTIVEVFDGDTGIIQMRHDQTEERWELEWFDYPTDSGWHFVIVSSATLDELSVFIDSTEMPGDQNEGFHHMIDCIERDCC